MTTYFQRAAQLYSREVGRSVNGRERQWKVFYIFAKGRHTGHWAALVSAKFVYVECCCFVLFCLPCCVSIYVLSIEVFLFPVGFVFNFITELWQNLLVLLSFDVSVEISRKTTSKIVQFDLVFQRSKNKMAFVLKNRKLSKHLIWYCLHPDVKD